MPPDNVTIFQVLDNIANRKSDKLYQSHIECENFDKSFSKFILIKWMSMHTDSDIIKKLAEIQQTLDLIPDTKLLYLFLMKALPKPKARITFSYVK